MAERRRGTNDNVICVFSKAKFMDLMIALDHATKYTDTSDYRKDQPSAILRVMRFERTFNLQCDLERDHNEHTRQT